MEDEFAVWRDVACMQHHADCNDTSDEAYYCRCVDRPRHDGDHRCQCGHTWISQPTNDNQ